MKNKKLVIIISTIVVALTIALTLTLVFINKGKEKVKRTVSFYNAITNKLIEKKTVNDGDLVERIDAPKMTGFTFDDWYSVEIGKEKFDFAKTRITKDTTIWAHYNINMLKVTYKCASDDKELKTQDVKFYSTLTKPDIPYEGYTFEGWYTTKDCTKEFDFKNTPIVQDTTIWGKYNKTEVTLTIGEGGNYSTFADLVKSDQYNNVINKDGMTLVLKLKANVDGYTTCTGTDENAFNSAKCKIVFEGADENIQVTWKYGYDEIPSPSGSPHNCDFSFSGVDVEFKNMIITDKIGVSSAFSGFYGCKKMTFTNCTFNSCIKAWGSGNVTLDNCTFNPTYQDQSNPEWNMYTYTGQEFEITNCTFKTKKGCIKLYKQDYTNHTKITLTGCTFVKDQSENDSEKSVIEMSEDENEDRNTFEVYFVNCTTEGTFRKGNLGDELGVLIDNDSDTSSCQIAEKNFVVYLNGEKKAGNYTPKQ